MEIHFQLDHPALKPLLCKQHLGYNHKRTEGCLFSFLLQMGSQGPQRHADMEAQRREFEVWLHKENDKLTEILNNQRSLSAKELRIKQNTLKVGGVCYIFLLSFYLFLINVLYGIQDFKKSQSKKQSLIALISYSTKRSVMFYFGHTEHAGSFSACEATCLWESDVQCAVHSLHQCRCSCRSVKH